MPGRGLLGHGMAKSAANDKVLSKAYRDEQIAASEEGREVPAYDEWKKQYMAQTAKAEQEFEDGYKSVSKDR